MYVFKILMFKTKTVQVSTESSSQGILKNNVQQSNLHVHYMHFNFLNFVNATLFHLGLVSLSWKKTYTFMYLPIGTYVFYTGKKITLTAAK